jgi:hypothetical protein
MTGGASATVETLPPFRLLTVSHSKHWDNGLRDVLDPKQR